MAKHPKRLNKKITIISLIIMVDSLHYAKSSLTLVFSRSFSYIYLIFLEKFYLESLFVTTNTHRHKHTHTDTNTRKHTHTHT